MKYVLTIAAAVLLCGCSKTVDYVLPQSPLPAERKPLTVPHRDWLESGCWFRSEDGHDVKVCHENTNSK
jgi:hypothetical protein